MESSREKYLTRTLIRPETDRKWKEQESISFEQSWHVVCEEVQHNGSWKVKYFFPPSLDIILENIITNYDRQQNMLELLHFVLLRWRDDSFFELDAYLRSVADTTFFDSKGDCVIDYLIKKFIHMESNSFFIDEPNKKALLIEICKIFMLMTALSFKWKVVRSLQESTKKESAEELLRKEKA